LLKATLEENVRRDKALRNMVRHMEKESSRQKQRAERAEEEISSLKEEMVVSKHTQEDQVAKLDQEAKMNELLKSNKRRDRESELEHDLYHERQKNQKLTGQMEDESMLLDFYRVMTSTRVAIQNKDGSKGTTFDCTFVNFAEKKAAQIRVTLVPPSSAKQEQKSSEEDKLASLALHGEMKCAPVANAQYLPEFMQDPEPIEFDRTQCPLLLKSVLASMFSEDDDA
jgi:hypothetical protein